MKLEAYLKRNKLSPEKFADKVGCAGHTLRRYMAGRVPDPDVMVRIHTASEGKVKPNDFYNLQE